MTRFAALAGAFQQSLVVSHDGRLRKRLILPAMSKDAIRRKTYPFLYARNAQGVTQRVTPRQRSTAADCRFRYVRAGVVIGSTLPRNFGSAEPFG